MLISVDLPAPFSPMMPVMAPRRIDIEISRLAIVGPKRFSIWRSSIAIPAGGGDASPGPMMRSLCCVAEMAMTDSSVLAGVVGGVIMHLDLAGDDIGLGLIDLGLDLRRQQLFIVLVIGIIDAAFLEAERGHAGLPGAGLGILEAVIGGDIDMLDHRGQHGAGMQVVLIGIDADRQLAVIGSRLIDAGAGTASRRENHIDAAIELALRQLAATAGIVPGRRRRARHGRLYVGLRIGIFGALLITAGKFADQRNIH